MAIREISRLDNAIDKYAALSDFGCPEIIVSDNAKVFIAHNYLHILEALEIKPKYIEKGKPGRI
jgi:hypothetical protein